jgi:large subunit ribosomal protein L10
MNWISESNFRNSGLDPGAGFSNRVGSRDRHRGLAKESKVEKAKKAEVVEDLNGVFAKAGSVVIAHYSGMTVANMADLRTRMRAAGASFQVAKNRLAMRALKGTPVEGIAHLFKGPTGIAVSNDPVAASKVAVAYAKDNEKLVILGGAVGSTVLDAAGVKALATLPSLDQLRGKIVGLLVAPATKIAGVVQAPAGQLARVIGAYSKKDAA